jgi:PAS domain S-box-containing protein
MSQHEPAVLHLDDDQGLLDLSVRMFERIDPELDIVTATTVDAALDTIKATPVDRSISDYDMPGWNGLEFLNAVRECDDTGPFVLMTGQGSEEIASDAISAGVDDYLQKKGGTEQFTLLATRVRNLIERHRATQLVNEVYDAIDHISKGASILDDDGEFIYVNRAYAEAFGYEPDAMVGEHWSILYRDDHDIEYMRDEVRTLVTDESTWRGRTRQVRKDGTEIQTDHRLALTGGEKLICLVDPVDPVG